MNNTSENKFDSGFKMEKNSKEEKCKDGKKKCGKEK